MVRPGDSECLSCLFVTVFFTVTLTAWFSVIATHCRRYDSEMKAEEGISGGAGCILGSR
jgi:hypothetical protein